MLGDSALIYVPTQQRTPCASPSPYSLQSGIDNFLYSVTFLMRLTALRRWELLEGAQLFLQNTSWMWAGSSCGYVQKSPCDSGNYFPLHRPSYLTQKARLRNEARYKRTHSV